MNCGEWEERIALYAGGELSPDAALDVERHLGQCAGCQVFASGMRQSLEWLKSAHQELPAPAHFAAVRARVLSELGRRTGHRFLWSVTVGAIALAAILIVVLTVHPPRKPATPAPVVAQVPAPVEPPVQLNVPLHSHIRRTAVPKRRRTPGTSPAAGQPWPHKEPEPSRPLVVKLVTADPDVVIYWIADNRGGE